MYWEMMWFGGREKGDVPALTPTPGGRAAKARFPAGAILTFLPLLVLAPPAAPALAGARVGVVDPDPLAPDFLPGRVVGV